MLTLEVTTPGPTRDKAVKIPDLTLDKLGMLVISVAQPQLSPSRLQPKAPVICYSAPTLDTPLLIVLIDLSKVDIVARLNTHYVNYLPH